MESFSSFLGPEGVATLQSVVLALFLAALTAVSLVIRKGIAAGSAAAVKWIEAKAAETESSAHYAALKCLTSRLDTLSTNAVAEVEQTLVRKFKKQGKWDSKSARMARDTAVDVMRRQLGEQGMEELKQCSGLAKEAIIGMFRTWVERKVSEQGSTTDAPVVAMGDNPDDDA